MRNTNRLIALALCFTLTLGAFVYRPPQAKAVAGVDDAIVIGALLSAFAGGCGLIFSNNGMSSNEIAQGLTAKWNDFKETLASVPADFPAWLGYDSMDALITDLRWDDVKDVLSVPLAVARKFSDFTDWLAANLSTSSTIATGRSFADTLYSNLLDYNFKEYSRYPYYVAFHSPSGSFEYDSSTAIYILVLSSAPFTCSYVDTYGRYGDVYIESSGFRPGYYYFSSSGGFIARFNSDGTFYGGATFNSFPLNYYRLGSAVSGLQFSGDISLPILGASAPAGVQTPDLADDAETAPTPTITGVGLDAATIEELLQQILDQVQSNTLATTISVDATQPGGETGTDTDEDAKPYLPFIPQIFEKVKEIPGTLSNIWDTVKQLPAAIAEKISAFFTTLWGWLQDIITEIKALPAAIAEKVGALFTPDQALVTEITDTFKGKFGFLSTLKQFANDLFGMTADSEPPVIWIHLENAESKFGYNYGGKEVALDLSWYQKYKPTVDGIVSGFLWIGYLWMLFTKAPDILNGMGLRNEAVPPMPNLEYINPLRLNGRTSKKRRD